LCMRMPVRRAEAYRKAVNDVDARNETLWCCRKATKRDMAA